MICPVCAVNAEPVASAGAISICGACGSTCHVDAGGAVRRATLHDVEALTDDEVRVLRKVRAPIVRPKR